MYTKWLTLVTILVVNCDFINSETFTKYTTFDDYLDILESTANFRDRLRITEAVWGEIHANYPDDLTKIRALYQTIYQDKNIPVEGRQAANELMQEIRNDLSVKNSQLLANVMNGYDIANTIQTVEFLKSLARQYEPSLVRDIYFMAIDKMYNVKAAQELAWFLRQTTQEDKSNSFAFQNMIESQLYLYWKFMNRREVNDLYLFNVGYYFSQIKSDPLYQQVEKSLKHRIDEVIDSLPSSVRYFYYKPKFCLLNKDRSEFLYTPTDSFIDNERSHVFTWTQPYQVNNNYSWYQNLTELNPSGTALNLEFSLEFFVEPKNVKMFMYLEQNLEEFMNIIAAWRSGEAPAKSAWSVQLLDNALVFSQNGFIMCTIDGALYNEERRNVYAYEEYNALSESCQWIARECPLLFHS